ncbi:MAG: type II secretion system secretin GspD [Pseudomonadota bacterium]
MFRKLRRRGWIVLLCGLFTTVYAQNITLNLDDVDIRELVRNVSEITGKTFVVDERVKAKVTVVSKSAMSEDELYDTFLSILSVHGYAAVPSGKIVKILPAAEAKSQSTPVTSAAASSLTGDQVITRVIKVEHVSAAQLIPILRPLVPQQGHIAAYPENNTLIISDRAANVNRLARIIQRVDNAEQNEVDVIRLDHAAAEEVVQMLTALSQQTSQAGKAPAVAPVIVADKRTNSVLLGGDPASRLRLKALIAHLDTPLKSVGNTQVIYLRFAQASDLAPILQGVNDSLAKPDGQSGTAAVAAGKPGEERVRTNIQADDSTNSLIITATPDVQDALKLVVDKLDIRREQVLVEAIIAEIESSRARDLGVQWIFDGSSDGTRPVGLINFDSPGAGLLDFASSLLNNSIPISDSLNGATFGAGRLNSDNFNFAVLVQALAADSSTNVLSTPSLMTLDNQEAEIVVGRNVPFVTGQFTNTGATAGATNPFQTIQREDVGLTLRVRPQINEGNIIKLDIEQEMSSLVPNVANAADIITSKREIKTTVMVEDGHMVVLGGLIDENLTETDQKVPLLGDVPVLGNLFRSQESRKTKTNLMVFLHPVILRDSTKQKEVTERKYEQMRKLQMMIQEDSSSILTRNQDIPLLPDMNELLTVLPGDDTPLSMQAQ